MKSKISLNLSSRYLQRTLAIGLIALLSGCGASDHELAVQREKNRKLRQEKASEAIAKGPTVHKYQLESGEVLVLEIPYKDRNFGSVEYAKCFVWTKEENRSSAMHCISESP